MWVHLQWGSVCIVVQVFLFVCSIYLVVYLYYSGVHACECVSTSIHVSFCACGGGGVHARRRLGHTAGFFVPLPWAQDCIESKLEKGEYVDCVMCSLVSRFRFPQAGLTSKHRRQRPAALNLTSHSCLQRIDLAIDPFEFVSDTIRKRSNPRQIRPTHILHSQQFL